MADHMNYLYTVTMKTGDKKGAGTDANVCIILHDKDRRVSEKHYLDNFFRNDFESGQTDTFDISLKENFESISQIELWRDGAGMFSSWYVDWIEIVNRNTTNSFIFPMFRWIKKGHHYLIHHLDTSLPKDDLNQDQREMELEDKRHMYELVIKVPNLPIQVGHKWVHIG